MARAAATRLPARRGRRTCPRRRNRCGCGCRWRSAAALAISTCRTCWRSRARSTKRRCRRRCATWSRGTRRCARRSTRATAACTSVCTPARSVAARASSRGGRDRRGHRPHDHRRNRAAVRPGARAAAARVAASCRRRAADFVLTAHHLIVDGWSLELMLADWWRAYAARLAGRGRAAGRRRAALCGLCAVAAGARRRGQRAEPAYWRGRLAGATTLELPFALPRAAARARRRTGVLHDSRRRARAALARRQGGTLFTVMLAAWRCLLGDYAGGRLLHRHDRVEPRASGQRAHRRLLREPARVAHRAARLRHVRRAGRARARHRRRRAAASGGVVRPGGRAGRRRARCRAQPAVPGQLRAAGHERRGARRRRAGDAGRDAGDDGARRPVSLRAVRPDAVRRADVRRRALLHGVPHRSVRGRRYRAAVAHLCAVPRRADRAAGRAVRHARARRRGLARRCAAGRAGRSGSRCPTRSAR